MATTAAGPEAFLLLATGLGETPSPLERPSAFLVAGSVGEISVEHSISENCSSLPSMVLALTKLIRPSPVEADSWFLLLKENFLSLSILFETFPTGRSEDVC